MGLHQRNLCHVRATPTIWTKVHLIIQYLDVIGDTSLTARKPASNYNETELIHKDRGKTMANFVSKTGVWNVVIGETELEPVMLDNLTPGKIVKVICQFFGRTMTDDLGDGYNYRVVETQGSLITATPDMGLVQGSDSWQFFSHIVLFEVPTGTTKAEFKLQLSRGDMNGKGSMMNYMLMAELLD